MVEAKHRGAGAEFSDDYDEVANRFTFTLTMYDIPELFVQKLMASRGEIPMRFLQALFDIIGSRMSEEEAKQVAAELGRTLVKPH